jgi:hypothetical protein
MCVALARSRLITTVDYENAVACNLYAVVQWRSGAADIPPTTHKKNMMYRTQTQAQSADHPGRYLYYVRTFWLYLQSHFRLRNVTLVCVLCAYNGHLTMALV